MKPICSAGATTAVKSTSTATICRPSFQSCCAPPTTVVEACASDRGQAEHRHGVGDDVEHRRRERQRERAVERVLAAAPELPVAARAARRRPRREVREALQQVAVRAGDQRRRLRAVGCGRRARTSGSGWRVCGLTILRKRRRAGSGRNAETFANPGSATAATPGGVSGGISWNLPDIFRTCVGAPGEHAGERDLAPRIVLGRAHNAKTTRTDGSPGMILAVVHRAPPRRRRWSALVVAGIAAGASRLDDRRARRRAGRRCRSQGPAAPVVHRDQQTGRRSGQHDLVAQARNRPLAARLRGARDGVADEAAAAADDARSSSVNT